MDGCVPDSSKYVPGRGAVQLSAVTGCGVVVVGVAGTSVANDWTRVPWDGGTNTGPVFAIGQVVERFSWAGLAADVAELPKPPPIWPTITTDVGMLFGAVPNDRLFVRLMTRFCPVGTVITTGDQTPAPAFGFKLEQVAVEPVTTAPQL
jgi:hypothetical protein